MEIKSPILYCCYNRIANVKKSISILKNIYCPKIYIALDGPKNQNDDVKKCLEVKKFIQESKFNSKVVYLIRSKNLGCKKAIAYSIDWFFEKENKGIILEDDLIPCDEFFKFCDYGLKKYENNNKIMMIGGTNYLGANVISNKYHFSEHFLIWGWATWKRAWSTYDIEMKTWKSSYEKQKIKERFGKKEFEFLNKKFNSYFNEYHDTWDIQWYYSCVKNHGLAIMPEANLVTNIGLDGTHSNSYYKTLFLDYGKIDTLNLNSPIKIEANKQIDLKIHKKFNFENLFFSNLKKFLKKFL